jgi:hypothetical protein
MDRIDRMKNDFGFKISDLRFQIWAFMPPVFILSILSIPVEIRHGYPDRSVL